MAKKARRHCQSTGVASGAAKEAVRSGDSHCESNSSQGCGTVAEAPAQATHLEDVEASARDQGDLAAVADAAVVAKCTVAASSHRVIQRDGAAADAAAESTAATSGDKVARETADEVLAMELAAFLRRHRGGLAVGALAGADVRQALRDPMRAAGFRSFKAKWLSRFPALLLFDGKTVCAAAAAGEAELADESHSGDSVQQLTPAVLRSCLRAESAAEGVASDGAEGRCSVGAGQRPARVSFSRLLDMVVFKVQHEPSLVARKGQHVQRPVSSHSDEEEEKGEEEMWQIAGSKKKPRSYRIYAKEHWLESDSLLPESE